MKMQNKTVVLRLILSIALCQMAGVIGSVFTAPAIKTWFIYLNKPFFSPPNWLFAPAWLTLYTLMGVALYLIIKSGQTRRSVPTIFFLIHLIFNASWSIVFFGMHQILGGLIVIFILWAMILILIKLFGEIDKRAAWLLIPYLLWVSFATVLNTSFYILN